MAKLKIINKTTNNFWIAGYCFIPGETTTGELTLEEEIKARKLTESPSITQRVEGEKIQFKFEGKSKMKKDKEEKEEKEDIVIEDKSGAI